MAQQTDNVAVTITWDDAKFDDPKDAFARIYNRPTQIPDPSWVPGTGQTEADRPSINNPVTKRQFMKNIVSGFILGIMRQDKVQRRHDALNVTLATEDTGATVA